MRRNYQFPFGLFIVLSMVVIILNNCTTLKETTIELSTVEQEYLYESLNSYYSNAEIRGKICSLADQMKSKRKKHGGQNPYEGFDCSGLVYYVFNQYDVQVPRTVKQLYQFGNKIDISSIEPADLLFFDTKNKYRKKEPSHVGLYITKGYFIHVSSKRGQVAYSKLNNSYWKRHYVGAVDVISM